MIPPCSSTTNPRGDEKRNAAHMLREINDMIRITESVPVQKIRLLSYLIQFLNAILVLEY